MTKPYEPQRDRRVRVARLRAEQRRAERLRAGLVLGTLSLLALAFAAALILPILAEQRREAEVRAAASRPIEGVQDFPNLSRQHVATDVDYPQSPPVGGDHAPVWVNCGSYAEPAPEPQAVHSLEHGAVWIGYQPSLPAEQLEVLTRLADRNSYVLLSPVADAAAPVVASAWGKQLALDTADDPRLAAFVRAYQQGSQSPEPGAACTGGVGVPA